jgi:hypothetical protein
LNKLYASLSLVLRFTETTVTTPSVIEVIVDGQARPVLSASVIHEMTIE